jgi:hypothetical protein
MAVLPATEKDILTDISMGKKDVRYLEGNLFSQTIKNTSKIRILRCQFEVGIVLVNEGKIYNRRMWNWTK